MVKGFDKEEFMKNYAEIRVDRIASDDDLLCNQACVVRPPEQTLVIHVNGEDYDVRELIWRLLRTEEELKVLHIDFNGPISELLARVGHLEAQCYDLEKRLRQNRI